MFKIITKHEQMPLMILQPPLPLVAGF